MPLWGIRSRQIDYGLFPADAFVFADGGRVWSEAGGAAAAALGLTWRFAF